MQKLINVIALFAGLVAGVNVAIAGYVYMNRDAILSGVKTRATKEITKAVTDALPGMLDSAVPELPKTTGPALPF